MSSHLRDIGGYRSTVGYICYRGTEPWGKRKSRPGGMSIEKQQDMDVLDVDLSPSMSVEDRFAVRSHVMLNACLALSWSDKSFRP